MKPQKAPQPAEKDKFNHRGDPSVGADRLLKLARAVGWTKGNKSHVTGQLLDRALTYKIKKIPTGSFELDLALQGGVALDRLTRFWGQKNSGKTTMLLKILGNMQKFCRYCKCALLDTPEGFKDCQCPSPRYRLEDRSVLSHLHPDVAAACLAGNLPEGCVAEKDRWSLTFRDGKTTEKAIFRETDRCQPMQIIFIETEGKLDDTWAAKLGVMNNLVYMVGTRYAEETIDTAEALLYSGQIDGVFIDTLSFMVTKDDIQKKTGDKTVIARHAVVNQRLIQKLIAAKHRNGIMCETPITVLIASQLRWHGIGQSFGANQKTSDGNAVDYATTTDIELKRQGYDFNYAQYSTKVQFSFTIHKNHAGGGDGVSGSYFMASDPFGEYPQGYMMDVENVFEYGEKAGIIIRKSSKYGFVEGFPFQETFKTQKDMREYFMQKPSEFFGVRRLVLEASLKQRTALPSPKHNVKALRIEDLVAKEKAKKVKDEDPGPETAALPEAENWNTL